MCSPGQHGPAHETLRGKLEVADIFRTYGNAYRESYPLSTQQRKVMSHIEMCRTAALGGHLDLCDTCGHELPAYNSCRDRHCPKCQSLRQAIWIEQRKQRILPTHCFHVVFTIPHELNALALRNKELIYTILFQTASKTLLELGQDPKRLGATLGITAVLHTWTRDLRFHPHVHCIVTGGGLSPDQKLWVPTKIRRYLFPEAVISSLFRGKFLDAIVQAYHANAFDLGGSCTALKNPAMFEQWKDTLYRTKWVIYAKTPFGGAQQVINYLGRYIHRVAISNQRLLSMDENGVCFLTKGQNTVTLPPEEFIRRFLLHILPPGFIKIRHYGLMGASNVTTKLLLARRLLLGTDTYLPPTLAILLLVYLTVFGLAKLVHKASWQDLMFQLSGVDIRRCPKCGKGKMVRRPLPASERQKPSLLDTS
jgi:hypothetical protein